MPAASPVARALSLTAASSAIHDFSPMLLRDDAARASAMLASLPHSPLDISLHAPRVYSYAIFPRRAHDDAVYARDISISPRHDARRHIATLLAHFTRFSAPSPRQELMTSILHSTVYSFFPDTAA